MEGQQLSSQYETMLRSPLQQLSSRQRGRSLHQIEAPGGRLWKLDLGDAPVDQVGCVRQCLKKQPLLFGRWGCDAQ